MEKLSLLCRFRPRWSRTTATTRLCGHKVGDGPAELSEVVELVYHDVLSKGYFAGAGNLTDVHIHAGMEKAVHLK